MATFFLCMIYAAFISLGLPDSLLGAAWPAMQPALGVPLDSAGVLSMIVAGGTVVASLSADRMLHRFGTGRVTLVSVTMTAAHCWAMRLRRASGGLRWRRCQWAWARARWTQG